MKSLFNEFFYFLRVCRDYGRKRLHQAWVWFEAKKDLLVGVLITRRGTYARPFLHTSLFVLIITAIVSAPILRNTFETHANELSAYTTPSAVLSSFDDQSTATERSDRGRDGTIQYTVADGDTVSGIADKFNISSDTIRWANDLKTDTLKPGQTLDILPVSGISVKVKKGDTIYTLAKKYNTNPQKIVDFPSNDFTDLDTFALAAGQDLILPDGVMPDTAPVNIPAPVVGNIAQAKPVAPNPGVGGSGQFIWPTQGVITQGFSYYHPGIDIANNALPPVAAADGGTVVLVQYLKYDYGHHVVIDHGNGFTTLYAHMTDIYVTPGQTVSKGQVIGKMGSTGRSTGPHLHFEVRKNGVHLSPLSFLP